MRTIAHISDIHVGKLYPPTLDPLVTALHDIRPDLLVVSGDLTQRARRGQFEKAKAYLERLPKPQLVVPGNHDIPLFNLLMRFWKPLRGYHKYITGDMTPVWADDEIIVVGINTSRRLERKGGRIGDDQVDRICRAFEGARNGACRIVVTHHPFDLPLNLEGRDNLLIGSAAEAMERFSRCGAELFLSGHLHVTNHGSTGRYGIPGYSALVAQAGTATSSRYRGELNAFNVIEVDGPAITVRNYDWQPATGGFAATDERRFARVRAG